jgi:hypothetical protein
LIPAKITAKGPRRNNLNNFDGAEFTLLACFALRLLCLTTLKRELRLNILLNLFLRGP